MNHDHPQHDELLNAVREALDRSVERLDPAITMRLQRARLRAVEAQRSVSRWLVAGGLVTATVATVVLTILLSEPVDVMPVHEVEDSEVVTTSEALDFYDEIDFYRWLAEHHGEG